MGIWGGVVGLRSPFAKGYSYHGRTMVFWAHFSFGFVEATWVQRPLQNVPFAIFLFANSLHYVVEQSFKNYLMHILPIIARFVKAWSLESLFQIGCCKIFRSEYQIGTDLRPVPQESIRNTKR